MNLKNKKLFLLDMDGTLYLDGALFPETLPFLEKIKEIGGKALFLTNNSSKSAVSYVEKLEKMGIHAHLSDFVTSVQATAAFLETHHKEELIYVCGTTSFKKEQEKEGLSITDTLENGEREITCLVCGFDTELTFKKLDDCSRLLTKGVTFIATNPDWVCPTSYGYVPDCGSVCEMLFRATGKRPRFIGKPQPEMVYMALEKTGFKKEEALLVGDRLYTDIACAKNAGIDGAFVLSGEGTLKDIAETGVEPTFVFENVGEITKLLG
jgi:HAD superfamily hydrolase (TIGR01450 family)